MRIGLVTGEYPPMEGGVGAFTQALAQALHAEGHAITILTDRAARPEAAQRVRRYFDAIDIGYAQLLPLGRKWRWGDIGRIADMVDRYDLDLINIQYQASAYNMRVPAINWAPWRLASLIPTVVTFHDLRVPYLFPKAGKLRERVVWQLAKSATGAIVTNEPDARQLTAILQQPPANIPIGSNIETHTPPEHEITAARRGLGLSAENQLLGYFGFLNPTKGADLLIETLARLPETYHAVFIGGQTGASDGSTNQQFRETVNGIIAANNLTERVHWTGFVDDGAVSTWLHAADMMVMPYRDGVSLRRGTLMAILAHGRPLVTTKSAESGAAAQLNGAMQMVAADADSFRIAIEQVASDVSLRNQLSANALTVAARFSWNTIAAQTGEYFDEMLRLHRNQR